MHSVAVGPAATAVGVPAAAVAAVGAAAAADDDAGAAAADEGGGASGEAARGHARGLEEGQGLGRKLNLIFPLWIKPRLLWPN